MSLGTHPLFLSSATNADAPAKRGKPGPETMQLPVSYSVYFTMQPQTQSNWCWAAVATSTSLFYLPTSSWTQCTVANGALARTDCCATPYPCNVTWFLDSALTVTGNYVSMGGPSVSAVAAELQAGRPVGARVGWAGGGGHFVVIIGFSNYMKTEYFTIDDPFYGASGIRVMMFELGYYQGSGTWTHNYYTKAAP